MSKRIGKLLLALGVLVGSLLIASPAQAHSDCAYHVYDAACVGSAHTTFTVCDREADGHRVWGYVQTRSGAHYWGDDKNGSAEPCYSYYVPSWDPIVTIWAYEEGEGFGAGTTA